MGFSPDQLIHDLGAIGVALGAGLEGESAVVIGGTLARRGLFSPIAAALGAFAGSFVADQIFFALGRSRRDGRLVGRVAAKPAFARALNLIERNPVAFCLSFRFVYGFRVAGPVAIGVSKLPMRTFLVLNAVSAAAWAVIFTALGWRFGHAFERILTGLFTPVRLIIAVGITAAAALVAVAIRRRRSEGAALDLRQEAGDT